MKYLLFKESIVILNEKLKQESIEESKLLSRDIFQMLKRIKQLKYLGILEANLYRHNETKEMQGKNDQ